MKAPQDFGGTTSPECPPPPPSVLRKKAVRLTVFFLFLGPILFSCWVALYGLQRAPHGDVDSTIITIAPGTGIREIRRILADAGLIVDDIRFLLVARYLDLATKLPAGEFRLSPGQTPGDLLRQLATARPVQHTVTIPEGLRIEEIADIFVAGSWCDRNRFIALARDSDFIRSLGLKNITSLEGYLYPDTYHLTRDTLDTRGLITMLVNRFHAVWSEVEKTGKLQMSRQDIVALASMVEKETADTTERPLIAAVFLNRLKTGMRLQSDPTVIYGLEGFSGNLTRADLKANHPYNTYVVPALPAGPICSPGQKALEAVLHPAATDFLYFVSRNNGTHQFSKNLFEHNQAVQKFQLQDKK